nr:PP2C family protein-serine/threonine phosphatase [Kineococcus aurantiacus]
MVTASATTGDAVEVARQAHPRSPAAELVWRLLPPLTADTGRFSVSGLLEPAADVGGDVFDYALAADHVDLAVLDAMGHALGAGLMASAALAAYRACRRAGGGLLAQAAAVDDVLVTHFPDALVTGVLLHLDLGTGRLTYVGAGHPAPVVLRAGRAVADLDGGRRTPFGLPVPGPDAVGEASLEPGDWIALHTDGVEEARDAAGEFFGRPRLVDFLERAVAADLGPAETARRLLRAIMEHQGDALQDDATVLLARWRGEDPHPRDQALP